MSNPEEKLDIIDENDLVVGQETRAKIHEKGLLHREVHIWFITPDGHMIFQHRAKDKGTYPDLLDATVGGHVEPGMSYEETALKEMEEETGMKDHPEDLHFLKKLKWRSVDEVTRKINNVIRFQYAYVFKGQISELRVEKGKAIGFEAWPIDKLYVLNEDEKKRFIPFNYSPEFLDLFRDIKKIISK